MAENKPDRVKIVKKAKVTKCIKEGEKVVGVEYEKDGKHVRWHRSCLPVDQRILRGAQMLTIAQYTEHGAVILATGGYAADFTSDSLLKKHRPEYYDLVSLAYIRAMTELTPLLAYHQRRPLHW